MELPRFKPVALVPMKFPSTTLSIAFATVISMPSEVLKPMTFAAAGVVPPMVLLDVPTMTPTPLPRLSPLESVPMKLPSRRLSIAFRSKRPLGRSKCRRSCLRREYCRCPRRCRRSCYSIDSMTIPEPSKLSDFQAVDRASRRARSQSQAVGGLLDPRRRSRLERADR